MKAKVILFWSQSCPHCPPAKKMIEELKKERQDFELVEVSPQSDKAKAMFDEYNIDSTPTFIIQGEGHPENMGLKGNQAKKVLNKYIDIALGKRKLEEKKGIFQRIIDVFS